MKTQRKIFNIVSRIVLGIIVLCLCKIFALPPFMFFVIGFFTYFFLQVGNYLSGRWVNIRMRKSGFAPSLTPIHKYGIFFLMCLILFKPVRLHAKLKSESTAIK